MIKAGDTVTLVHDCISHGGQVIHEANDRRTVLAVETKEGHYSRLCPDIWIPERVTSVLLVGFDGWYIVDSFYENNIGSKVAKTNIKKGKTIFNKKPFKSTLRVNTIKGVIIHPELGIPAYTFEEDDSYVECRRCKILNHDEIKELTN